MVRILSLLACLVSTAAPAMAASSPWFDSEGGAVRIVTSGLADDQGRLRGAIEIRLKPGWKTYWQNPGASGVPPQIDVSGSPGIAGAEILFPPPERMQDSYAAWAGYKHSVSLPVIFTLKTPETAGVLEGSVFLGICETICIPVETSFSFDAGANPYDPADAAVVDAAFAELPARANPDFAMVNVSREGDRLLLEARLPANGGEPVLFIAGPEGTQVSMPTLQDVGKGRATFSADFLGGSASGAVFDYTLVAGEEAVSGTFTLP